MSVEAFAIALNHSRAKGAAKLVLLGIANHDGDGGAWPSMATLARYGAVTPRNAQKAVDELERLGEVRRRVRQGGTARTPDHLRPNLYEFILRCPPTCDHSKQHRVRGEVLVLELSTPLSPTTPPVAGDGGAPVAGDTRTILEPSVDKELKPAIDARAVSAERYELAILSKCPRSRRGHSFAPSGYCNNCGVRQDERVRTDRTGDAS